MPEPPYYAVIFYAQLSTDLAGYEEMVMALRGCAESQPGFLALRSLQQQSQELTISYWRDLAAINAWKAHPLHRKAQALGKQRWYRNYEVEVVRVDKQYQKQP